MLWGNVAICAKWGKNILVVYLKTNVFGSTRYKSTTTERRHNHSITERAIYKFHWLPHIMVA